MAATKLTSMMLEDEWQDQVVQLAHLYGWQHLHVRRTIGRGKQWVTSTNRKGWPDLFLWHARWGFLAVELKAGDNMPTDEQLAVLDELSAAGAATFVWWPEDLDEARVVLAGPRPSGGAARHRSAPRVAALLQRRSARP